MSFRTAGRREVDARRSSAHSVLQSPIAGRAGPGRWSAFPALVPPRAISAVDAEARGARVDGIVAGWLLIVTDGGVGFG